MSILPALTYILCAATAGACAVLLLRGYQNSGLRMLWWSGVCFVGLACENVLLFIDMEVVRDVDLSLARHVLTLAALLCLLIGLIWNARSE